MINHLTCDAFTDPLICLYLVCFRYRSGGGKSQNQNDLTAEELRSFVQQLDNLPCNIRQGPLLKVKIKSSKDL